MSSGEDGCVCVRIAQGLCMHLALHFLRSLALMVLGLHIDHACIGKVCMMSTITCIAAIALGGNTSAPARLGGLV